MKRLLILCLMLLVATSGFAQTRPHWLQIQGVPFVDVRTFGAKGDGVTDDHAALQAWVDYCQTNGLVAFLSPGDYLISDNLRISADLVMKGAGREVSRILLASGKKVWARPLTDPTLLPTVASNIAPGDNTFDLVSAPSGVSSGDILTYLDTTDYSWSISRPNFRRGEMVKVDRVSGATITSVDPAAVGVDAGANVKVYKFHPIRVSFHDLRISVTNKTTLINALVLAFTKDSVINNVFIDGDCLGGLEVGYSYNTTVTNSTIEAIAPVKGNNYAFSLVSSKGVIVDSCYLYGTRKGFDAGQYALDYDILPMDINISNSILRAQDRGTGKGLGLHGGVFGVNVIGCTLYGAYISGDNTLLSNNIIKGSHSNVSSVFFTELSGFNHRVSDNIILIDPIATASHGICYKLPLNLRAPKRGGTMAISGNTIYTEDSASGTTSVGSGMLFEFTGVYAGGDLEYSIDITGNTIRTPDNYLATTITFNGDTAGRGSFKQAKNIRVVNNTFIGRSRDQGIALRSEFVPPEVLIVSDNYLDAPETSAGIYLAASSTIAINETIMSAKNNIIRASGSTAGNSRQIWVTGNASATIFVNGNIIENAGRSSYVWDALEAHVSNNSFIKSGSFSSDTGSFEIHRVETLYGDWNTHNTGRRVATDTVGVVYGDLDPY